MYTTALKTQTNAPWGIARLSNGRTSLANRNPDLLNFHYTFDDTGGRGTDAFIFDSGCRVSHKDFGGRARCFPEGRPCEDANGREYHSPQIV